MFNALRLWSVRTQCNSLKHPGILLEERLLLTRITGLEMKVARGGIDRLTLPRMAIFTGRYTDIEGLIRRLCL